MTVAGQPGSARHVCSSFHSAWDRDLEPALEVEDGELVELHVPDASRDQIGEAAVAADLASVDFDLMNPVAGPVFVRGARPGDVLEVEVLEVRTRAWGWTAIVPGFGLLADDFPAPWLRISRIEDGRVLFGDRFELPCRPFPGTIGVAPEKPGAALGHPSLTIRRQHRRPAPHRGSDTFPARRRRRRAVLRGRRARRAGRRRGLRERDRDRNGDPAPARRQARPTNRRAAAPRPHRGSSVPGSVHITTGIGENLHEAARSAARAMIDLLSGRFGLAPEEAYALTSIAGDLRIHEIVNAPRWVVGMALPAAVLA